MVTVNSSLILSWFGLIEDTESRYSYIESNTLMKTLIAFGIFLSIVGWAFGIMLTKELKHTSTLQINLHLGITSCILSGLISFVPLPGIDVPSTVATPLTFTESLWAFSVVGTFLCLSSIFYIGGVKTTKNSGTATIVGFTAVVQGYLISIVRYGEFPNVVGIVGSLSIFVGLVLVVTK